MATGQQDPSSSYDRLSRWYDALAERHEGPLRQLGLDLLGAQPGQRILEIGCGTGAALLELAQAVDPNGLALGLDKSAGMLEVASGRLGRAATARLIRGDARRLPLAKGSMDGLFMSYTLELFGDADMRAVLTEGARVLRPSAPLAIVAMAEPGHPTLLSRLYAWANQHWPDVIDCRPIPARAVLESAGFAAVTTRTESIWGLPVHIGLYRAPAIDVGGT
jgi:demethylmenaquinone methyltransferase/2-methoxy-6-polyprenyl-1,4-benzoquinol methylase